MSQAHRWIAIHFLGTTQCLGNMLDFNGNGIIDPNEAYAPIGTAMNAFRGFTTNPNLYWQGDVTQLGVIPVPGSVALAGLAALALRRRRA